MPSQVKIVAKNELDSMHTGTLLRRRTALLQCEDSVTASDRSDYQSSPNPDETGWVEFKDQPQWRQAYGELKDVLATREHNIPTGQEKRSRRIKQSQKQR